MTIETNEVTEGVMYTKTTAREASVLRKPTSEPNWRKPQEYNESFKVSQKGPRPPKDTSTPPTASLSSTDIDVQQTSSPSPARVQNTSSPSPPCVQEQSSPSQPHAQQRSSPSSARVQNTSSPSPPCVQERSSPSQPHVQQTSSPSPPREWSLLSSSAPDEELTIPPPLPPKQAQLTTLPPLPPKQAQPILPPPLPPKQAQLTCPPPLPPKQAQLTIPPPLPPKQAQLTKKAKKNFDEQNLWRRENVLPKSWIPTPRDDKGDDVTVHLVELSSSSTEYQDVERNVHKTVHFEKIKSIERIQNPYLYQAYQLRKLKMDREHPHGNNERQLFHGTNSANITKINAQGFDRSFTSSAHGAVYGAGVYFARDASYSMSFTGGSRRVMYLARVLVGRYCEGNSRMKKPPPINSEQPEILFDSMVDDMKIPTIFVTYYDNQCYPEYLITF